MDKKILKNLMMLLVCILLISCFQHKHNNHVITAKPQGTLRIVTYNINWGEVRSNQKPEASLAALQTTEADIIFLQECTPFWENQINHSNLAKRYAYRVFKHYPNAGGLAILSKYPFKTQDYLYPHLGWHPTWIITSQTPLGLIQLVNIHLTPSVVAEGQIGFLGYAVIESQKTRKQEIMEIVRSLRTHLPTIIAGDFNEGNIGRAVAYLRQQGFIDALKQHNVRSRTWEWQIGPLNFNDQFDRFFYTPDLTLLKIQVLHEGDSDHYPVIADFKLRIDGQRGINPR